MIAVPNPDHTFHVDADLEFSYEGKGRGKNELCTVEFSYERKGRGKNELCTVEFSYEEKNKNELCTRVKL